MKKIIYILLTTIILLVCVSCGQEIEKNEEKQYEAIINDELDLLTDKEERKILDIMKDICKYGNVMFVTAMPDTTDTKKYAKKLYHDEFQYEDGSIFIIDMKNRYIYVYGCGEVHEVLDGHYDVMVDNVYEYASDNNFYLCAKVLFEEQRELLKRHRGLW